MVTRLPRRASHRLRAAAVGFSNRGRFEAVFALRPVVQFTDLLHHLLLKRPELLRPTWDALLACSGYRHIARIHHGSPTIVMPHTERLGLARNPRALAQR